MYLGCDLYAPCKRRSLRMVIVTGIHDPADSRAGMNNPDAVYARVIRYYTSPSPTLRQNEIKKNIEMAEAKQSIK